MTQPQSHESQGSYDAGRLQDRVSSLENSSGYEKTLNDASLKAVSCMSGDAFSVASHQRWLDREVSFQIPGTSA